ncbi:unnamed protein product [Calicophoron daubneyi]|uniref:Core Histone H2A/H2B/H3 domain-containing protein n=1 Tax=Calicophoron daubneyi TaxID=300641 RepID=A0AAV2TBX7_CALDB
MPSPAPFNPPLCASTPANRRSQSEPRPPAMIQEENVSHGPSVSARTAKKKARKPDARASSAPPTPKRRSRVLAEIRKYQKSTELLLRKLPFCRIVRQIMYKIMGPRASEFRVQAVVFLMLQEVSEALLVALMEACQQCAIHARRITVMPKDLRLVLNLQGFPPRQS